MQLERDYFGEKSSRGREEGQKKTYVIYAVILNFMGKSPEPHIKANQRNFG
jgi:hypothetical protein